MRAELFIGTKGDSPVRWLVHRRFLAQWIMVHGGRKVRDAKPEDGTLPPRKWWCAAGRAIKPEPVTEEVKAVEPERKTKRRSRKRKASEGDLSGVR